MSWERAWYSKADLVALHVLPNCSNRESIEDDKEVEFQVWMTDGMIRIPHGFYLCETCEDAIEIVKNNG